MHFFFEVLARSQVKNVFSFKTVKFSIFKFIMPEIKLQLNDPKVLEAIEWYSNQAILFQDTDAAYRLVRILPKYMAETPIESPDIELTYQKIILKAKFIALDRLKDEEIVDLLKDNFSLLFELDHLFELNLYDLWEKVRAKLVVEPVYTERDELKKKIREAILVSEQILTPENLFLDAKKVKGAIKNWLTDYNRTVGIGKVEALKLSEYLVNSPNAKSLSEQSRKKLDYLLKFYERIKLSSLDYDGIEEPMTFMIDNKIVIFKDGKVEKIGRDILDLVKRAEAGEKMLGIKKKLEDKYRGSEEEAKKIEEEIANISKITVGNFKKLSNLLFAATNPGIGKAPNKLQAEAILKILAKQGNLEDLLEEKRFNEMMIVYFREKGRTTDLEGFKVNPKAPQFVSALLQHILKDKVGMSEDESARFGMQLVNLLTQAGKDAKYSRIVYFDEAKEEFEWVK